MTAKYVKSMNLKKLLDDEIFEKEPPKPIKTKRVISDEAKSMALINLKAGREKALSLRLAKSEISKKEKFEQLKKLYDDETPPKPLLTKVVPKLTDDSVSVRENKTEFNHKTEDDNEELYKKMSIRIKEDLKKEAKEEKERELKEKESFDNTFVKSVVEKEYYVPRLKYIKKHNLFF